MGGLGELRWKEDEVDSCELMAKPTLLLNPAIMRESTSGLWDMGGAGISVLPRMNMPWPRLSGEFGDEEEFSDEEEILVVNEDVVTFEDVETVVIKGREFLLLLL